MKLLCLVAETKKQRDLYIQYILNRYNRDPDDQMNIGLKYAVHNKHIIQFSNTKHKQVPLYMLGETQNPFYQWLKVGHAIN